jgi:hypothetical protein
MQLPGELERWRFGGAGSPYQKKPPGIKHGWEISQWRFQNKKYIN